MSVSVEVFGHLDGIYQGRLFLKLDKKGDMCFNDCKAKFLLEAAEKEMTELDNAQLKGFNAQLALVQNNQIMLTAKEAAEYERLKLKKEKTNFFFYIPINKSVVLDDYLKDPSNCTTINKHFNLTVWRDAVFLQNTKFLCDTIFSKLKTVKWDGKQHSVFKYEYQNSELVPYKTPPPKLTFKAETADDYLNNHVDQAKKWIEEIKEGVDRAYNFRDTQGRNVWNLMLKHKIDDTQKYVDVLDNLKYDFHAIILNQLKTELKAIVKELYGANVITKVLKFTGYTDIDKITRVNYADNPKPFDMFNFLRIAFNMTSIIRRHFVGWPNVAEVMSYIDRCDNLIKFNFWNYIKDPMHEHFEKTKKELINSIKRLNHSLLNQEHILNQINDVIIQTISYFDLLIIQTTYAAELLVKTDIRVAAQAANAAAQAALAAANAAAQAAAQAAQDAAQAAENKATGEHTVVQSKLESATENASAALLDLQHKIETCLPFLNVFINAVNNEVGRETERYNAKLRRAGLPQIRIVRILEIQVGNIDNLQRCINFLTQIKDYIPFLKYFSLLRTHNGRIMNSTNNNVERQQNAIQTCIDTNYVLNLVAQPVHQLIHVMLLRKNIPTYENKNIEFDTTTTLTNTPAQLLDIAVKLHKLLNEETLYGKYSQIYSKIPTLPKMITLRNDETKLSNNPFIFNNLLGNEAELQAAAERVYQTNAAVLLALQNGNNFFQNAVAVAQTNAYVDNYVALVVYIEGESAFDRASRVSKLVYNNIITTCFPVPQWAEIPPNAPVYHALVYDVNNLAIPNLPVNTTIRTISQIASAYAVREYHRIVTAQVIVDANKAVFDSLSKKMKVNPIPKLNTNQIITFFKYYKKNYAVLSKQSCVLAMSDCLLNIFKLDKQLSVLKANVAQTKPIDQHTTELRAVINVKLNMVFSFVKIIEGQNEYDVDETECILYAYDAYTLPNLITKFLYLCKSPMDYNTQEETITFDPYIVSLSHKLIYTSKIHYYNTEDNDHQPVNITRADLPNPNALNPQRLLNAVPMTWSQVIQSLNLQKKTNTNLNIVNDPKTSALYNHLQFYMGKQQFESYKANYTAKLLTYARNCAVMPMGYQELNIAGRSRITGMCPSESNLLKNNMDYLNYVMMDDIFGPTVSRTQEDLTKDQYKINNGVISIVPVINARLWLDKAICIFGTKNTKIKNSEVENMFKYTFQKIKNSEVENMFELYTFPQIIHMLNKCVVNYTEYLNMPANNTGIIGEINKVVSGKHEGCTLIDTNKHMKSMYDFFDGSLNRVHAFLCEQYAAPHNYGLNYNATMYNDLMYDVQKDQVAVGEAHSATDVYEYEPEWTVPVPLVFKVGDNVFDNAAPGIYEIFRIEVNGDINLIDDDYDIFNNENPLGYTISRALPDNIAPVLPPPPAPPRNYFLFDVVDDYDLSKINATHCDDKINVQVKLSMYDAEKFKPLMEYKQKFDTHIDVSCNEKKIEHELFGQFMTLMNA